MDGFVEKATTEELKMFYGLDRELYTILVSELCRNPLESLQIMGLWLWLERLGICNVISKILAMTPALINLLADEAVTCLDYISSPSHTQPPSGSNNRTFGQISALLDRSITHQFFHTHQNIIVKEMQKLLNDIYIPVLSDIMDFARSGGFAAASSSQPARRNQSGLSSHAPAYQPRAPAPAPPAAAYVDPLSLNFAGLSIQGSPMVRAPALNSVQTTARPTTVTVRAPNPNPNPARGYGNEPPSEYSRTMFATFSKGYPVTEGEVRHFFTTLLGECIDSLHMQEVRGEEQPLYARIVFLHPGFIQSILNGQSKAKFTINGKHVWMRRFVPRNGRILPPCGCPPHICPHQPQPQPFYY
ncbi:uncharacterized protein LOC127263645 [Andrographis paniculata]|uniref:uncharacterized protein LOC127263645 n=1 Tax=Andrographis paniculata TaxID=175694 RepID=UPI0021E6DB71|nr:uncharacterized protein LOC127263645 [Andrographis paniculata]XP_051148719.1 uncharacterized protein LOC127263645 [Andrographis paniculata]XP_051148720.1 uncharacterized protein LOC127263645 [Andrographis paniculata]XP_051148721.1 uncharacterized protein LOC127263645 [Andrographis paniculata]